MDNKTRLNKILSESGICSRREADRIIESGEVTVNGEKANLGMKVMKSDRIFIKGKEVLQGDEPKILLAFYKPRGIVCTTSKIEKDNIIDYIGYPHRIFPVGRLDKESEGLILLTNNGDLMDQILRSRNGHEKEYIVRVNKQLKNEVLRAMAEGVPILNTMTKPCKIKQLSEDEFSIVLTQGLNRQIRRMCEYFNYRVLFLKRIRIINIYLDDLEQGKYRMIDGEELKQLCIAIQK